MDCSGGVLVMDTSFSLFTNFKSLILVYIFPLLHSYKLFIMIQEVLLVGVFVLRDRDTTLEARSEIASFFHYSAVYIVGSFSTLTSV